MKPPNSIDVHEDYEVLTVNEVGGLLRTHRSTVYRLLKRGELPYFRIGGTGSDYRIRKDALNQWIEKRTCGTQSESKSSEKPPPFAKK